MRVCIDTNVFLQLFGSHPTYRAILSALRFGDLTMLVSTEILLEYEEIATAMHGWERARRMLHVLEEIGELSQGVVRVEPHFRFRVIAADADDNKFTDCAIAGSAEFIATFDRHFEALENSGYSVRPIVPDALARLLTRA